MAEASRAIRIPFIFLDCLLSLTWALSLWFLLQIFRAKQSLTFQLDHPIVFTVVIYWLVALLSLSTVTTDGQLSFLLWPILWKPTAS